MIPNKKNALPPEAIVTQAGAIIQQVCRNLQTVEVCGKGCSTFLSPAMFAAAFKRHLQDHHKGSDVAVAGDKLMLTLGGGLAKRFSPESSRLDVPFADFWMAVSEVYAGTKGVPILTVPEADMAILAFARIVNKSAVEINRPVEIGSSLRYGAGNAWG